MLRASPPPSSIVQTFPPLGLRWRRRGPGTFPHRGPSACNNACMTMKLSEVNEELNALREEVRRLEHNNKVLSDMLKRVAKGVKILCEELNGLHD